MKIKDKNMEKMKILMNQKIIDLEQKLLKQNETFHYMKRTNSSSKKKQYIRDHFKNNNNTPSSSKKIIVQDKNVEDKNVEKKIVKEKNLEEKNVINVDIDLSCIQETIDVSFDEIKKQLQEEVGKEGEKEGEKEVVAVVAESEQNQKILSYVEEERKNSLRRNILFETMINTNKNKDDPKNSKKEEKTENEHHPTFDLKSIESFVNSTQQKDKRLSSSSFKFALNEKGKEKLSAEHHQNIKKIDRNNLPFGQKKKSLVFGLKKKITKNGSLLLNDSPSKRIITDYKLDKQCTSKEAHRFERARRKEVAKIRRNQALVS